jgi:ankyrin repeat protein
MALLNLPTELVLVIEEHLPTKSDVNALIRCHPRMLAILQNRLYDRAKEPGDINKHLAWACELGYEGLASAMLNRGANATGEVNGCLEPLAIATMHGHFSLVKLLLEHDPSIINAPYRGETCTALMCATVMGNLDIVRFLLAQPQLDPQKRSSHLLYRVMKHVAPWKGDRGLEVWSIPVDQALYDGNEELVRILLADHRVHLRHKSLTAAVAGGNESMIRLCLLEHSMEYDRREKSLLLVAARNNHTNLVKLLLQVASQNPIVECEERTLSVLITSVRAAMGLEAPPPSKLRLTLRIRMVITRCRMLHFTEMWK